MAQEVLKVGLIGGGGGAFIVNPHQKAIHMDGTRRVVCGALHENPELAMKYAAEWPYPIQGYPSYDEMIKDQARKPKGERVDYILIVTPNFVHYDPAIKCLRAGIPVFCEKPQLAREVEKRKIPFGVAHTYLGHWSSWFSRWIIRNKKLGEVRWVDAYYLQGWLATKLEDTGQQQASWRTDPKRAGASCCGGDIGTHAYMQLRFVTGLEVTEVRGMIEAIVRASQICIGHKNDLGIEVACEKGTLAWRQEDAERVTIHTLDGVQHEYWRNAVSERDPVLGRVPKWLLDEPTIPSGHCEAFHDAFALYNAGKKFKCDGSKYANVHDGVMHMKFVEAAVKSAKNNSRWVKV